MKTERNDAIAGIATPIGEGGIGVVQVLGPGAIRIAKRIFRPTRPREIGSVAEGRLCHGFVFDETGPIDEVILRVCPKAMLVEINCHGGIAAVKKVYDLVIRAGAEGAPPAALLPGAMEGSLDAIQREALRLLPEAVTQLAVRMLLAQYHGALSSRLAQTEGDPRPDAMLDDLDRLLETAAFGMGLCTPRRIVVAGKPNVGKSTLVNALLREERVIVHHLPGTTRDAITETAELRGIPFELVDTAGLRRTMDEIEAIGVSESERQIARASLVILVLDLSAPVEQEDGRLLEMLSNRDVILVANKADMPPAWTVADLQGRTILPISAREGAGMERLEAEIVSRCGGGLCRTDDPIVFTARQRDLLASARAAAGDGQLDSAGCLIRKCVGAP